MTIYITRVGHFATDSYLCHPDHVPRHLDELIILIEGLFSLSAITHR